MLTIKKISLLITVLILTSCGSNNNTTENKENIKVINGEGKKEKSIGGIASSNYENNSVYEGITKEPPLEPNYNN